MKLKALLTLLFLTFNLYANANFNIYNAFKKAQIENKPIYYVVADAGCSHCVNYLEHTIIPNFKEINRNFVFALSDLSRGDKVPSNLPFTGVTPTTYIISPQGQLLVEPIKGDFGPKYFRELMSVLYKSFQQQ